MTAPETQPTVDGLMALVSKVSIAAFDAGSFDEGNETTAHQAAKAEVRAYAERLAALASSAPAVAAPTEPDLAATVYVGRDKLEVCWHGQLPEGVHHLYRVADGSQDSGHAPAPAPQQPTPSPTAQEPVAARWERRRGHSTRLAGVVDAWSAWQACTEAEAKRVTGLRTWEVRRLECFATPTVQGKENQQ